MLRLALVVMLLGVLFIAGSILHLITASFMLGLACALVIEVVLWLKVRRRKPTT